MDVREITGLAVKAVDNPLPGVEHPAPHQRYQSPRLEIVRRPCPEIKPGFVLLEILTAGICGTDVHLLQTDKKTSYVKCSAPASIPPEGRILGHECVGRVVRVGAGTIGLKTGDVVSCESVISCGVCIPCREGYFNQCSRAELMGLQTDGVFATHAVLPQRICHPIGDLAGKPHGLLQAACLEPAAVAHVALEHAPMENGDRVLVFGAGPIGLFLSLLARNIFGGSHVDQVEPLELRRNLARSWADGVFTPEEFWRAVPAMKHSYDLVLEASGDLGNVTRIIRYCGCRARVVLLARSGASLSIADVDAIITNAISLIGSRGHLGGAFAKLIKLCSAGRLPLHEVVTTELHGLPALKELLLRPDLLAVEHSKVMVHLAEKPV